MVNRAALLAIAIAIAGCHRHVKHPVALAPSTTDELTLYRDRTLVKQRVEIDIPPADKATVKVRVPIGIEVDDIVVLDRGELIVSELRAADHPAAKNPVPTRPPVIDADNGEEPPPIDTPPDDADDEPVPAAPSSTSPTEVTFVVSGPHAGHYALYLGYVTDRITWDAAYTMTTTPARKVVSLRGAIAIRNATGVAFAKARAFVVDTELGAWRGRLAEQFAGLLAGTQVSTTPVAQPRPLGTIVLGTGETRIELLPGAAPRKMASVLVYDPIGTKIDHGGTSPIRDPALGVVPAASSRVTESFEVTRTQPSSEGLPGGPVRLLERRPDGSLAVLAETRLFDAATRVADVDTIAIGTAQGVTGKRERRELTVDDDGKRLVEEFVITLTNTRAVPVEVALREHLYRGQNWTLAYYSVLDASKEGPQQIAMHTTVPAHGETRVMYVVVYTWEPATK